MLLVGGTPRPLKPPEGGTPNGVGNEICQTNPIGPEPDTSQVLCGTAVRSASAPEGLRKTNPMGSAPSGTSIPPASLIHGRGSWLSLRTDAHATGGRDARAAAAPGVASAEPGGEGVNLAADQGRFASCRLAGFQQGTMTALVLFGGQMLRFAQHDKGGAVAQNVVARPAFSAGGLLLRWG